MALRLNAPSFFLVRSSFSYLFSSYHIFLLSLSPCVHLFRPIFFIFSRFAHAHPSSKFIQHYMTDSGSIITRCLVGFPPIVTAGDGHLHTIGSDIGKSNLLKIGQQGNSVALSQQLRQQIPTLKI